MRCCRADRRDDTLADARDDGFFGRPADEPCDVRSHRDPRLGFELNPVFGHRVDRGLARSGKRNVNHLRVDGSFHCLEDVAPRQVDRRCSLPRQGDLGSVGGDHRANHVRHPPPGQEVRLQIVRGNIDPRLLGADAVVHDLTRVHFAELHHDQIDQPHRRAGDQRLNPQADELEDEEQEEQDDDAAENQSPDYHGL